MALRYVLSVFQELLKNMIIRGYLLKNALFSMIGVYNELFMRNIPISKKVFLRDPMLRDI